MVPRGGAPQVLNKNTNNFNERGVYNKLNGGTKRKEKLEKKRGNQEKREKRKEKLEKKERIT